MTNDLVEFGTNLFPKLQLEVIKSNQRIASIADGILSKGKLYQNAIEKFRNELNKGLKESTKFTKHEILYIVNEVSINRNIFDLLIESDEFDSFVLLVKKYQKITIYKKMFVIYFNYYSTLQSEGLISVLTTYLKYLLKNYNGRNEYIAHLVLIKEQPFAKLPKLLEFYDNDFEKIKTTMNLQDSFEFSKALLNLKIIQELKSLQYDEENREVFSTILERKEMFFDEGLTLKEYVSKYLIDRAIEEQKPFNNWQIFIIKLVGDPRSTAMYSSTMRSWNIIGETQKNFFIRTLSKDDLKLFLEALSDSVSDTNYHYRKAFWMQFLENVVFAKIMIGSDAYKTINETMKQKFKLHNESYGRLQSMHNQSAVYIDFGNIKILEFTHSGQVRGFSECPIELYKKDYSKKELDGLESSELHIFSLKHASPKTYTWQKTLLEYLNNALKTRITLNDIEIEEDKQKREAIKKRRRGYF